MDLFPHSLTYDYNIHNDSLVDIYSIYKKNGVFGIINDNQASRKAVLNGEYKSFLVVMRTKLAHKRTASNSGKG
jgi:hypothetical protein